MLRVADLFQPECECINILSTSSCRLRVPVSDVESEDGEGHSRKRASGKQGHEQRGEDQDVTAAGGQGGNAREAHPGHRRVGQVADRAHVQPRVQRPWFNPAPPEPLSKSPSMWPFGRLTGDSRSELDSRSPQEPSYLKTWDLPEGPWKASGQRRDLIRTLC